MAGFSQYLVRLQRDSLNTTWGFRLQGGRDVGQALSVQRVFSGTAAEGELQRGDLIAEIEHRSTDNLTHKEAQDVISNAGGSVLLTIKRPPSGHVLSPLSPNAKPVFRPQTQPEAMPFAGHRPTVQRTAYGGPGPTFGTDYSKRPAGSMVSPPARKQQENQYMMNRVQQTLDHAIYAPAPGPGTGGRYDPDLVDTSPQYIPQQGDTPVLYKNPVSPFQRAANPTYQSPTYNAPPEPHRPFKQPVPVHYEQPTLVIPVQHQSQIQQYQAVPQAQLASQVRQEDDEEEYEHLSVSERKKHFQKRDASPRHIQPGLKRQPRPQPRLTPQNRQPAEFGVDYSRGHVSAPVAPIHRPVFPSTPTPPTPECPHSSVDVVVPGQPAWRGTLKKSGNKPWLDDAGLDECYIQQQQEQQQAAPKPQQPRSVPIQASQARIIPIQQAPPQHSRTKSVPTMKSWSQRQQPEPEPEPEEKGPRVMHLQYNSPINMYSRENVQHTLAGQVGHVTPVAPVKTQKSVPFGKEPRDWDQSAVYRMIHGNRPTPQQQQQSQSESQNVNDDVGTDF